MALLAATFMLSLALLSEVLTSRSWQPCVPYAHHQVNNVFKTLLPTTFGVSITRQDWSADFIIKGPNSEWRLGLRLDYKNKNKLMVTLHTGEKLIKSNSWPAEVFSVANWTDIDLRLTNESVLEATTSHQNHSYTISSGVREGCRQFEVLVYQLTTARLVWECPRRCIGQQVMQDNSIVYLNGKNNTLFMLPQDHFQLNLSVVIKNCVFKEENLDMEVVTQENLNLKAEVWNEVSIYYIEKEFHGGCIRVREGPDSCFFTSKKVFKNCNVSFLRFRLRTKKVSMGSLNCGRNEYFKNDTWKQSESCAITPTHNPPPGVMEASPGKPLPPSTRNLPPSSTTVPPSSVACTTLRLNRVWVVLVLAGVAVAFVLGTKALALTVRLAAQ